MTCIHHYDILIIMKNRIRLDHLIQKLFPQYSRQQIQSWIMQGKVTIEGEQVTKPGMQVSPTALVTTSFVEAQYVSRAGFKLEKALKEWHIDVQGLICLDAGLSTGGFTDCLLQKGAKKVFGVDVGYGQVHNKIRHDARVHLMERTNLRNLTDVGQKVDLVTLDLSFISVLKVIQSVCLLLKDKGQLIILIKPQFEARKEQVGRGGIIRDSAIHADVINNVVEGVEDAGFVSQGVVESPLLGATGNKEFLAYFVRI